MRMILLICVLIFAPAGFGAGSDPLSRALSPSLLLKPGKKELSFLVQSQSQYIFQPASAFAGTEPWVKTNIIGFYESSFIRPSLNLGLQGSIGSSGGFIYVLGRWIPFPDFKYQPAVGLLSDIGAGFNARGSFQICSNIQFLLSKTFAVKHSYLKETLLYFSPLAQMNIAPKTSSFFEWHLILGWQNRFLSQRLASSQFSIGLEGWWNTKQSSIVLKLLLPLSS